MSNACNDFLYSNSKLSRFIYLYHYTYNISYNNMRLKFAFMTIINSLLTDISNNKLHVSMAYLVITLKRRLHDMYIFIPTRLPYEI